jgi:hypothetical protein
MGTAHIFFENIRESSLKRELSIDTHFQPTSFLKGQNTFTLFFIFSFSVRGSSRKKKKYISHFMLMKGGESINILLKRKI